MCLVVLAWNAHPRFRLVLAANRDEFHDRPAAPLGWWADAPRVLAGRDLRGGGTWLGIARSGRFGVVTNYRDLERPVAPGLPSRGELVTGFLRDDAASPDAHLAALQTHAHRYAGFNLLAGDADGVRYLSNRAEPPGRPLGPGVHALGNERLGAPTPKLERTRARLETLVRDGEVGAAALFELLGDREPGEPDGTAAPGVPPDLLRALSAPFVLDARYGTRCSTVLLLGHDGDALVHERRFDPRGEPAGETVERFAVERSGAAGPARPEARDDARQASGVPAA